MTSVASYLVGYLSQLGVRHVFGVGGANIEDVYDALHRAGSATIGVLAKHEFSAATMADGYARVGERLGVVLATSGGGAMNLLPALAEAYTSRVPVLAIVGQPPSALDGAGSFQDSSGLGGSIDASGLFAQVARHVRKVDRAADFPQHLHDAVASALGDRGGPAVLLVPKDVQQASVDEGHPCFGRLPAAAGARPAQLAVDAVARFLAGERAQARAIHIIAGDGVARHGARAELARLAEVLDAHVSVAPDARDVFDNHDPRFTGVTGVMGHPSALRRLAAAGSCVLVGTRMPHVARAGLDAALRNKPVISLHEEASFLRGAVEQGGLEILGNVRETLRALLGQLAPLAPLAAGQASGEAPPPRAAPADLPRAPAAPAQEHLPQAFLPGLAPAKLVFRDVLAALAFHLPDDANVFVDAGNTGASAVHHLKAPARGRHVVALGMGGMGYSFGAAIGAAFANRRRTFVLAGDGSFYMHGLEIHTAVEYDLPITFVIFNNNAHAMCFAREQLFYAASYSYNRFRPADIGAGVGAMFPSMPVSRVASAAELSSGLAAAAAVPGPTLVCVEVDAAEVPPFVPFLDALPDPSAPLRGDHANRSRKAG